MQIRGKLTGIFGVLIALAVSPLIGLALGFVFIRLGRLVLRRATRRVRARSAGRVGDVGCALV